MSSSLQTTEQQDRGLWTYVSASRLNLWCKCPLAFRFRYIDGIASSVTSNLFLGKVVHSALESYYRRRQIGQAPTPEDSMSFIESAWQAMSEEELMEWDSAAESTKCRNQAADLVAAYIREYIDQPERIVAMETSLETPLVNPQTGEDLGVPLYGIIDLVLDTSCTNEPTDGRRTTGGRRLPGASVLTLVDFKTAASASLVTDQAHAVQLTLYSLLLQGNGHEHVETEIRQIVKTKTPKICVHRFGERTDQQTRQFFDLCREYLDSLDRGVFNYRPCWSCCMCDYRQLCSG